MTDDPMFAELIALRKSRKVRQEEIAHDLGVAQGTVARWEQGARKVTSVELAAYARIFRKRWVLVDAELEAPPSEVENPE
jgi:transcriptional regulator with XRE-family HTH domain